ncbi:MAG: PDZ domain-containing protein [Niastella sp.]|nr:PDZ domain-containing protein [Niastella sp.]
MKKYFFSLSGLAALLLALAQPVAAQDDNKADKKDKVKQYDEIIIRKKTDKDGGKVTVEIKDGEVLVNGKPLDDFEDENISVRKRKAGAIAGTINGSPFRSHGGTALNFGDDDFRALSLGDSKAAFLGVATDGSKDGAKVEEVTKGSAAEKAGLKKGDVITKVGDKAVFSQEDVAEEVKKHKPEDKLAVTFKRDGKEQKVTATLGKRSGAIAFGDNFQGFSAPNLQGLQALPNFDLKWDERGGGDGPRVFYNTSRGRLGIKAQDTEDGKGVKVLDVDDESIAEKAGVKENDIITEFNGKAVNTADELAAAAREAREKPSVTVKVLRDGKAQSLELKTPKKLKTANL